MHIPVGKDLPASIISAGSSAASAAFGLNPYPTYLNKANLTFAGNLDDMRHGWTTEEQANQRRLVQFWRQIDLNTIHCSFAAVAPADRVPEATVVSCIYWAEREDYFVTSVDTIQLLESLISVRFTVEEKNRIRRNLEGFRPITVSKSKADCANFFRLLMNFPAPKPRNIEKDVKVFHWRVLAPALKKIIGKYTASYSSTRSVDIDLESLPQKNMLSAPHDVPIVPTTAGAIDVSTMGPQAIVPAPALSAGPIPMYAGAVAAAGGSNTPSPIGGRTSVQGYGTMPYDRHARGRRFSQPTLSAYIPENMGMGLGMGYGQQQQQHQHQHPHYSRNDSIASTSGFATPKATTQLVSGPGGMGSLQTPDLDAFLSSLQMNPEELQRLMSLQSTMADGSIDLLSPLHTGGGGSPVGGVSAAGVAHGRPAPSAFNLEGNHQAYRPHGIGHGRRHSVAEPYPMQHRKSAMAEQRRRLEEEEDLSAMSQSGGIQQGLAMPDLDSLMSGSFGGSGPGAPGSADDSSSLMLFNSTGPDTAEVSGLEYSGQSLKAPLSPLGEEEF